MKPPGPGKMSAMMHSRPMAFMRGLTFPGGQQPVIRGREVYLRYPRIGDYANWAKLRGQSRQFLSKWEPVWADDELTKGAFRRRIKRYHKETRLDSAYVFFVFRMSDALHMLIPFVFGTLGLHRIEAACLRENEASRNLLAKAGFREEGLAKRYLLINGEWSDHVLLALLEDEASVKHGARLG